MSSRKRKSIYIWSMCIGGIGGLFFIVSFFVISFNPIFLDNPTFHKLHNFVIFVVSLPVFYLIGLFVDDLSIVSSALATPLFLLYWVILGMAIACGLVWLFFFIMRKCRIATNTEGPACAKDMKKKKHKKIVVGIIALVVVSLIAMFVCTSRFLGLRYRELTFIIPWYHAIYQAQQRRVLLLCKTDHHALLKAGREILSHESVKKILRDKHGVAGVFPVPRGVRIPQAILDLRPHTVVIDYDGYLFIEMHGGIDHFGVRIYPEGVNKRRPLLHEGRKLLEGLVYYDEGYDFNPEYDKVIDELIKKHKRK